MTITDSNIRAAVWLGTVTGTWYVDVYYARRRTPGTAPHDRLDRDSDPSAEVIQLDFDTRLEALDYADSVVGLMRVTAALAATASAGMVTTAEALAALGLDDDGEADCDA